MLPIGHRLAVKAALSAPDLADEPVICPGPHLSIGAAIVIAFAEANLRLRIAVEASQSSIACELVQPGAGIAILDGLGLLSARTNDLVRRPFAPSLQGVARLLKEQNGRFLVWWKSLPASCRGLRLRAACREQYLLPRSERPGIGTAIDQDVLTGDVPGLG
ncbi:hypothetical protein JJB99_24060 [Bradyrhizobium diazoefficiens]|uniref:LysR substrate-binding domain-containing protein n=1 Tax=Bradyrhizobium diazoefficiens TaxID=1355477 RepID=UPI00190AB9A9|nr:LysR substrate-binding domain-containing protein [Bradyrhizobium diazoefficiens]QQO12532.1 hypothetical protein JJB99_24060 [Bradyrhizobium diazoefficiens]